MCVCYIRQEYKEWNIENSVSIMVLSRVMYFMIFNVPNFFEYSVHMKYSVDLYFTILPEYLVSE
jgi:hypothetical protein